MALDIQGLYQMIAGFVPAGLNPKTWLVRAEHTYGLPQTFKDIDALIAFYPLKYVRGNEVRIVDYPSTGTISKFVLNTDPVLLVDLATEASLITKDNWRNYFDEVTQVSTSKDFVWNFAPDDNGAPPPHKTTKPHYATDAAAAFEPNWVAVKNPSKGHKWGRVRSNNDFVLYEYPSGSGTFVKIYLHWSLPINLGNPYAPHDFIANRWRREDVPDTEITDPVNMTADKWYVVEDGTVTETDSYGNNVDYGKGAYFQNIASSSFSFDANAIVTQIPDIPSKTLPDGTPNNEPTGWTDGIPAGAEQLWKIWAQMTKYGELKSSWYLERVVESPDYVRYSNKPAPLPSTLIPTSASISDSDPNNPGDTYDDTLNNNGWVSAYDPETHIYIATRKDEVEGSPGPPFTEFRIERIELESGIFLDKVFKRFPRTADYDSVILAGKPTGLDPYQQGWYDKPQGDTDTEREYYSEAWRFIDRTLVDGVWTDPLPYTSDELYVDEILIPDGDTFKYEPNDPNDPTKVIPAELRAIAALYKGNKELWEDTSNTLTFAWELIYNNGEIDPPTIIDNDTNKDIYYKGAHTDSDGNDWLNGQVVIIKPDGIDGKAYLKCTITLEIDGVNDLSFETIRAFHDFSDGIDARRLEISQSHSGPVLYDTDAPGTWIPVNTVLTPLHSNLPTPLTLTWYVYSGGAWVAIDGTEAAYTLNGNVLTIDNSQVFTADGTGEEKRYAVTNHGSDPDAADFLLTFTDYHTIIKTGAPSAGTDGVSPPIAILSNEFFAAILDNDPNSASYGEPISGEIGASGRAKTLVEVWKNGAKLVYNTDYTVSISPQQPTGDLNFEIQANGDDAEVYVHTWNNPGTIIRSGECTITITVTASGEIIDKRFKVGSTLDAPGAQFVDINSDKGHVFDPDDRTAKTLTAYVYSITGGIQTTLDPNDFYYKWFKGATGLTGWAQAGNTYSLARSEIFLEQNIAVKVATDAAGTNIIFTKTERFTDILDGRTFRLYSSEVSKPSPPSSSHVPGTTVGVWGPDPTDAVWASDGNEKPDTDPQEYDWSEAYKIAGEDGAFGPSSGFLLPMYKNSASKPSGGGTTWSLGTMETNNWLYNPPLPEAGKYLWRIQRPFQAYQADPSTGELVLDGNGDPQPVQFTNGKPNTNPMPGTVWLEPERLTAEDGINGDLYEVRFQINQSTTTPPDASTYDQWKDDRYPSGWVLGKDLPSQGTDDIVWRIVGKIDGENNAVLKGVWSYPVRETGRPGVQGPKGNKGDTGDTGPAPAHQWSGTQLRFQNPDGTWGSYVDLKGDDGVVWESGWTQLTLSTSGTLYYRRDSAKRVYLKGSVAIPITGGNPIGTLPAGYTPIATIAAPIAPEGVKQIWAYSSDAGITLVPFNIFTVSCHIAPNGQISINRYNAETGHVAFDNVSFVTSNT